MPFDVVDQLNQANGVLYTYVLIGLLIGGGLYFTIRTRAVQVRHFGTMIRYSLGSRRGAEGGISSFQAFAIGMATRIGIGNITGVALALILGGPGAIFWMWVVAAVGMATSFMEATLAQLFKEPAGDGTFRGGPAYYLTYGLRSRAWGVLFAVLLIFAMVVAMPMVQGNTIAIALQAGHGVEPMVTGIVLMVLTALVVFAGVRGVARAAEVMTPIMAIGYVLIAVFVIALNLGSVPGFLSDIVAGAFGLREGLAGVAGGVMAAILNGAQRGLFTNEAGMGSAPNIAASATPVPHHPATQGLVQSFGVFVDTLVVCTATALMILLSGVLGLDNHAGAALTQQAMAVHFGDWGMAFIAIVLFFFAGTSIFGNYAYAESATMFLGGGPRAILLLRLGGLAMVVWGCFANIGIVWATADAAMGLMALINLVAVVMLSKVSHVISVTTVSTNISKPCWPDPMTKSKLNDFQVSFLSHDLLSKRLSSMIKDYYPWYLKIESIVVLDDHVV